MDQADDAPIRLGGIPSTHYDNIQEAWQLLLGENLHYGLFSGDETLDEASQALTERMAESVGLEKGQRVLDVGCGTGTPALYLAKHRGVLVAGISTSAVGIEEATACAQAAGLEDRAQFLVRDGMDNGFPDESFDRVWILESSHLMPMKDALFRESARVLRQNGKLALCDVIRRKELPLPEVLRQAHKFNTLKLAFGRAKMESLAVYQHMAQDAGLHVEVQEDLSDATRPTFDRWEQNAYQHRAQVQRLIGAEAWHHFVESCTILREFWDSRTLGYGLLIATKPGS